MRFGFDIDDTLINLREFAFHLYNKKLSKNIDLSVFKQLTTVEIHEPFGLTKEEGKNLWNTCRSEIYFSDCPSYPLAVEVLNELVQKGHEVYYITARNKEFSEQTEKWMKKAGFPVEKNHFFCGMKDHEKINIIKNLSLDYYFDDKPAVLNTLLETNITLYVRDQSYNRNWKGKRLTNWSEIRNLL
ncbi:MAG TPA: HAD family acid phosphatase [Niallia sp.]|nr:HAD family acid phosphatase [Niallia sp.]